MGNYDSYFSLDNVNDDHKALGLLEKRHGKVVRDTFEEGLVKKWNTDSFSHGAFVLQGVYQRHHFMKDLMEPFQNIIFAAEYANKLHNGWVEAALESAIRELVNLWPEEFDKEFGSGE